MRKLTTILVATLLALLLAVLVWLGSRPPEPAPARPGTPSGRPGPGRQRTRSPAMTRKPRPRPPHAFALLTLLDALPAGALAPWRSGALRGRALMAP